MILIIIYVIILIISEVYNDENKDKQIEIYEFLKTYTENKGYPPSVREICEAVV